MSERPLHLLAFDPGKSSGIAYGSYSATEPYRLLRAWQVGNGVAGLRDWITEYYPLSDSGVRSFDFREPDLSDRYPQDLQIVAEKFVPLQNAGFAQTLDSTLPLVCEGLLIGYGLMPVYTRGGSKRWQRASAQYRHGGKDKSEKRKLSKQFLRDNGLYVTASQLGTPDNEDAISAILHSLNYLTHVVKHEPTWNAYYEGA